MSIRNQDGVAQARNAICDNAGDLLRDAKLLLADERAARAYALAHLALEECAKLPMLLRFAR